MSKPYTVRRLLDTLQNKRFQGVSMISDLPKFHDHISYIPVIVLSYGTNNRSEKKLMLQPKYKGFRCILKTCEFIYGHLRVTGNISLFSH